MFVGSNHGRPNLYAGTHPHSSSLGVRPQVVNQTLGWQSNYTVPYHWHASRWTGGFDRSIKNGQLIFIRQDKGEESPWAQRGKETTLMNLQMVNFALYHDEQRRQKLGFIQDHTGLKCYHDAAQYNALSDAEKIDATSSRGFYNLAAMTEGLRGYQFVGTCINEGAPFTVDDPQGNGGQNSRRKRLINVCIRGRQSTFNIWGDIRDGDQLYLELRKITVKGTDFNLDVEGQGTMDGGEFSCYQYVPAQPSKYASRPRTSFAPSMARALNDDEYTSEGAPQYALNIGRVFRTQRHLKMDDSQFGRKVRIAMSQQLTNMITKCPQFEILVDPCIM
jgi:hypothetical protein